MVRKALKEMDKRLHEDIFGASSSKVQVDMDELVLAGHSFGGITAINSSFQLSQAEQPRAVLVMDPWLYATAEDIQSGKVHLKCPIQVILSETWQGRIPKEEFDSYSTIKKMLNNCESTLPRESVTVRKSDHYTQTDFAIVAPFELSLLEASLPQTHYGHAY